MASTATPSWRLNEPFIERRKPLKVKILLIGLIDFWTVKKILNLVSHTPVWGMKIKQEESGILIFSLSTTILITHNSPKY